jgi:hypothetical protein
MRTYCKDVGAAESGRLLEVVRAWIACAEEEERRRHGKKGTSE